MIRSCSVIVADDHPVVREGMLVSLSSQPHLQVVGTAASFQEFWEVLSRVKADVVVLDIGNMGAPPIMTVEKLARSYPQLGIIVFSSSVDLVPELLQAGAHGYIVKEDLTEHLVRAIHAAWHGQRYLSSQAEEYLARCQTKPSSQRLTRQELRVLKQLALGQNTNEIAGALMIDPRSVYNYVLDLKAKTGCENRLQLVDWYRRVYGDALQ